MGCGGCENSLEIFLYVASCAVPNSRGRRVKHKKTSEPTSWAIQNDICNVQASQNCHGMLLASASEDCQH